MSFLTPNPFSKFRPVQTVFSFGPALDEFNAIQAQRGLVRADAAGSAAMSDEQLTTFMPEVLFRPRQAQRGREIFRITDGGLPAIEGPWKREILTRQGRARVGFTGKGKNAQSPTLTSQYEDGRTFPVVSSVDWTQQELEQRAAAQEMRRAGPLDIVGTKIDTSLDAIYSLISHGNLYGPRTFSGDDDTVGQPLAGAYGLLNFPTIPRVAASGTASSMTGIQLANLVFDMWKTILEANENSEDFRRDVKYNLHVSTRMYDALMRTATSATYPTMSAWAWLKQNATFPIGELMHEFWCKDYPATNSDLMVLLPDKSSAADVIYSLEVGGIQQSAMEIRRFEYGFDMYCYAGGLDCKRPRQVCLCTVDWTL